MPDPKAPANDPRHPAGQPTHEHFTVEVVDASVALAARIRALMAKHITPTERDPGPGPDLAELERRERIALDWPRREPGEPFAVITDMTGAQYSYGETAPGSGAYGWEPVVAEPPADAPDAPPADEKAPPEDDSPEDDLAAALAALDAKNRA